MDEREIRLTLAALRGAPLTVLFTMFVITQHAGRPNSGPQEIADYCGYERHAVARCLRKLSAYGLVQRVGDRYGGWLLMSRARQLVLGELSTGQAELSTGEAELSTGCPQATVLNVPSMAGREHLIPSRPSSSSSRSDSLTESTEVEDLLPLLGGATEHFVPSPDLLAALQSFGVVEPWGSEIAQQLAQRGQGADYVAAHGRSVRRENGGADAPRLLAWRLRAGRPAPEDPDAPSRNRYLDYLDGDG